jgi:hypothetical protein
MSGKIVAQVLDGAGKEVKSPPPRPIQPTVALSKFWESARIAEDSMHVVHASANKVVFSFTTYEPMEDVVLSVTWSKASEKWKEFLTSVGCWAMTHQSRCEKQVTAFFKKQPV